MYRSEYMQRLVGLLLADIALSFAYALVPPVVSPVRSLLALVQLGFMAVTMIVTMRYVLEDY